MEVATKLVDTELLQILYGIDLPIEQKVARSGNRYLRIGGKVDWPTNTRFENQFDSIMIFFNDNNDSLTLTFQMATAFQPYKKKSELDRILYTKKEKPAEREDKYFVRFHKGHWALKFKLTKTGKFQVIRMDYPKRRRYPVIWSKTACWEGETEKRIQELVEGKTWSHTPATKAYNAMLSNFLMQTVQRHVAKLKEKANGTSKPTIAVA